MDEKIEGAEQAGPEATPLPYQDNLPDRAEWRPGAEAAYRLSRPIKDARGAPVEVLYFRDLTVADLFAVEPLTPTAEMAKLVELACGLSPSQVRAMRVADIERASKIVQCLLHAYRPTGANG